MNGSVPTPLGWAIVALGVVAALYAIAASIWFSIHPGEEEPEHPKRLIFKDGR